MFSRHALVAQQTPSYKSSDLPPRHAPPVRRPAAAASAISRATSIAMLRRAMRIEVPKPRLAVAPKEYDYAASGRMVSRVPYSFPIDALNAAAEVALNASSSANSSAGPSAASHAASHAASIALPVVIPQVLPSELWTEIADFSSRQEILNLRAISREVKAFVDPTVTTVTLRGSKNASDFANSCEFQNIRRLSLIGVSTACLRHVTERLAANPRPELMMSVEKCEASLTHVLAGLSALPLASLSLDNYHPLSLIDVRMLIGCNFPLDLSTSFLYDGLLEAANIPNLRSLRVQLADVDDVIATWFSAHPTLENIRFCASDGFTARGMENLAALSKLRSLFVEFMGEPNVIDVAAATALAANPKLEVLKISQFMFSMMPRRFEPFSAESFQALCASQSLQTLTIPVVSGMQYLADLPKLGVLELHGKFSACPTITTATARSFMTLPNLQSLKLDTVRFEPEALSIYLAGTSAKHLALNEIALDENAVTALRSNPHLETLSIVSGRTAAVLPAQRVRALLTHPTLQRLSVDGVVYGRLSSGTSAAWCRHWPG